MSAPRVMMITLLLVTATSSAFYRLPLKRQQRSVQPSVKQDGTKVSLRNVEQAYDVAIIRVGDDPREFEVELDTGSSLLLLPSNKCKECGIHQKFHCAEESNVTVDIGYATGRLCTDSVTLGGLTVHNQHFIVMEREDKTLQSLPFDGFLGMGLKENSNGHLTRAHDPHVLEYITYQPETVIENMVQQGLLSFSVFSFYFTRDRHEGSEVTLGGSDPSHYTGNLSYASIIPDQFHWEVPLEGFSVGSQEVGRCNGTVRPRCVAEIHTGIPLIWVPFSEGIPLLERLAKMAPSLTTEAFGPGKARNFTFTVESKDIPRLEPITIHIAGEKFTLEPSDYVFPVDTDLYQLEFVVAQQSHWILGKTFLRTVYTHFDMEYRRIGFARAV